MADTTTPTGEHAMPPHDDAPKNATPKKAKTSGVGGRPRVTKAQKAHLIFPVSRIHRMLKAGRYAPRASDCAAVYLAAVLEYLVAEVIELAWIFAKQGNKKRISPRHIVLAVRSDDHINQLVQNTIISSGGVLPCLYAELVPAKKSAKTARRMKKMSKKKRPASSAKAGKASHRR